MNKTFWLSTVLIGSVAVLTLPTVQAQEIDEQLAQCAGIKNPLERLVCFDNVVAGKGIEASAPAANPNAAAGANQRAAGNSRVQGFGREHIETKDTGAPEKGDKIFVEIVKTSKNQLGYTTFETADGQAWQQVSAERFPFDASAEYYIERGVFNSYYLGRTDLNTRTRVKRLR